MSEKAAGLSASDFADKWSEKYVGSVVDKRKQSKAGNKYVYVESGPEATEGGGDSNAAPATAAPSLFADDSAAA